MNAFPRRLATAATLVVALCAFTAAAEKAASSLVRVEAKKVCMVNNTVFPKDQIPVQVESKTYYGCCEMCKERLAKDAAIRSSIDPVSGKKVDKALAVIGALPDGTVLYFENEESFSHYTDGQEKKGG